MLHLLIALNKLSPYTAPYKISKCKKSLQIRDLQAFKAVWTGLEPATSGVTGRHSNQTELPDLNLLMAMGILY